MKPSPFLRLSGIPERVGVNQEDGNQEFYSFQKEGRSVMECSHPKDVKPK